VFAVGFLLLDAVLLGLVGWWDDRPGLLIASGMFMAAAGGVVALRRHYLRRLNEIAAERAALRQEAASLARALHERE
jgi:hypothetical protein